MSVTQVVPELTKRGFHIDACAWYPWLHESAHMAGSRLGIGSMAMFYIGGSAACNMPWDFENIGDLLKAAACSPQGPQLRQEGNRSGTANAAGPTNGPTLHTYGGNSVPGQSWFCYRSWKGEKVDQMDIRNKLEDLLRPSTSEPQLRNI